MRKHLEAVLRQDPDARGRSVLAHIIRETETTCAGQGMSATKADAVLAETMDAFFDVCFNAFRDQLTARDAKPRGINLLFPNIN